MKYILLTLSFILLSGCATVTEKQYYTLQDTSYRHSFMINQDRCFIQFHGCILNVMVDKSKKVSTCISSKKHCVVNSYRAYNQILKNARKRREAK